jgi:hypothetical protein
MWQALFWTVFILVLALGTWLGVAYWSDAFRDAFVSSLLATTLGLILGVPIALKINGYQERHQEAQAQHERDEEAKTQKARVLGLLEQELRSNLDGLTERVKPNRPVPIAPLKMEFWRALSASGETKWIDDLSLLSVISTAYYHLGITAALESKFADIVYYPGLTVRPGSPPPGWKPLGEQIMDLLNGTDRDTVAAVSASVSKIDAAQKQVAKQ